MAELRAAVIGVGYLGNFHVEKYQRISGVRLVGVADTNLDRAKEIASRYQVKAYQNYESLLPEVDLVSIVVPSVEHFEVAKNCLKVGVHCLVEKPLTELVSQADELVSLAREKKAVLQVGHLERFNPVIRKVSGLIKNPERIKTRRFSNYQPRGTETDVILDLMIHDLDIVLSFAKSEVSGVQATGAKVITDHIDIANAKVSFQNGLVAELQASRVSSEAVRDTEIYSEGGVYYLNYLTHEVRISRAADGCSSSEQSLRVLDEANSRVDALYDEVAAFVASISSGISPVVTGEDGKRALGLAVEISSRIKKAERKESGNLIRSD